MGHTQHKRAVTEALVQTEDSEGWAADFKQCGGAEVKRGRVQAVTEVN